MHMPYIQQSHNKIFYFRLQGSVVVGVGREDDYLRACIREVVVHNVVPPGGWWPSNHRLHIRAEVDPDYTCRPEPSDILNVLNDMNDQSIANPLE
jgi:hypothetical protein